MSKTQPTKTAANATETADRDWWRGAVIYQIYPRSFQDTDGDGIGDLNGIIQRLPYIASLGVDAIWISPFFQSPMKDFGYDVSNYLDVDPLFGTLADFDRLIAEAHNLKLKVMIDLVLSHTSEKHPWFATSRSSRDAAKSDWYVWADAKQDGSPPNNWLSIFGGPAWTWDPRRRQYYLHNFLSSQPDLNFHNSDVQDALLAVARYWLEHGVDGMRLDTINFYFCDAELRDNPPLPVADRNASIAPEVNPYNFQDHRFDKNRPENLGFLRRLRALLDQYPTATALGEVGDAQHGMQILADYTAGNDKIHMCYAFDFLSADIPTAQRIADTLQAFSEQTNDSWPCWAFSNHDVVRHVSRWVTPGEHQQSQAKLLATLLLALRGTVCLYQGEELGFAEADVPFDRLQDPYGIAFWPEFKGRDGCRTPMVWERTAANGGFSTAEPWLPIPREHYDLAVSEQSEAPSSLLNHYRTLLVLRRTYPALVKGELQQLRVQGSILSFVRHCQGEAVFCVFNLGDQAATMARPGAVRSNATLGVIFKHRARLTEAELQLSGYGTLFARAS